MEKSELVKEIEAIARDIFGKPELVITDVLSAADVDTWTSLSFMQFLTAIEDKYGFKFKMMELLQLRNMGAVIDATFKHLSNV
jgi:acyl carrier protein